MFSVLDAPQREHRLSHSFFQMKAKQKEEERRKRQALKEQNKAKTKEKCQDDADQDPVKAAFVIFAGDIRFIHHFYSFYRSTIKKRPKF